MRAERSISGYYKVPSVLCLQLVCVCVGGWKLIECHSEVEKHPTFIGGKAHKILKFLMRLTSEPSRPKQRWIIEFFHIVFIRLIIIGFY